MDPADAQGEAYKDLEAKLRKVRDANRRDDVQLKFVYTTTPSPKDEGVVLFAVDAEEEGPDKSLLGDIYKQKDVPGTIPAHTVVDAPVSHLDLFPTILDYLGRPGHAAEGRNLRPLIERRETGADRIAITATARVAAQTGVEMEALTAVSIAALTIYDMCKAVDKNMEIGAIRLVSKTKK